MRWSTGDRGNINDMRGRSGGGGGMIPLGIGGFIVVALLSMFTGVDFFSMLGGGGSSNQPTAVGTSGKVNASPTEEKMVDMVDAIARDVQETWTQKLGGRYQPTKVTLFRDSINSACGYAGAVSGPFYCPGDQQVYLDLSFFDELQRRFGAPGDFAEAYVLAHEFGHHVQKLTGTESRVRDLQRADPRNVNALSVRLELQADCYAGVWFRHATEDPESPITEVTQDDLNRAVDAAQAVGDDRIQQKMQGQVSPETWTHGSAAMRRQWLARGFDSGDPNKCDTFARNALN
jgi:predicted metalloprotease